MEIVRARPGSPVTPQIMIFHVVSNPLDGSFSKCRCASDGGGSSTGSSSSSSSSNSSSNSSSSS
eukprot:29075-Heterocapsa_arctica.AAC.1